MTTPHKEITSGLKFPEGPVAMPDGSVVLVEIARQTLTRVMADGKQHVIAKLGGGPNGAAMGPAADLRHQQRRLHLDRAPDGRLFPGTGPPSTRAAPSRSSIRRPASSRRSTTPATAAG